MGIKRSTLYKLLLLSGFSFLLGFTYNYQLPKIESFLLVELESLSHDHSPIRLWAQKLNFHLLPLGVVLEDVRILAQPPLDKYLAPATLKEVGLRLAIWPLFRGEVRLSQIHLRDSDLSIFLKSDLFANKKAPSQVKFDFDKLYRLPIDEVLLEGIQIQGKLDPQNVVFRISDLNLLIENRYQSIFVEVNAPRILVKPSGPEAPLNMQLELRTLLEAQEMQVSAFKLKADESFVVASGRFNGDFTVGRIDNGALDARTKLRLADLNIWESVFSLNPRIPKMKGRAELDLGLELRKGKGYLAEADLTTHDVELAKIKVGQIQGHVHSDMKTITSETIHAENSAGKADINHLKIELEPTPKLSAEFKVPNLEIHQLLENLDVGHVPIVVPVQGEGACQGQWDEAPTMNCQAKVSTGRIHVDSGNPKHKTIVEAEDIHAAGQAKITLKQVEYQAEIAVGKNSSGRSDGVVNFADGFKINYQGDKLDMADVRNLVDLKVAGQLKVNGSTAGTTKFATIDMNVDGKDLWLEDYPLGLATAKVDYKAGLLNFSSIAGQFQVSRYNGSVGLNLDKDRIRIKGQIPFMDLKDVQYLFARKVTLPMQMAGTGTGKVDAEGPFRFQDLSYDFQSNFFRGVIANESFDELAFHVKSKDGLVKSDHITLTKANGNVAVKGQVTPQGQIDLVAVGRGLRLEQSENILAMGLDLQGLTDFTVLVRGQLPRPRVEVNGRMSKVILGDQAAEDSVFKLNFLNDRMEGGGQFLGSTVTSDFTIPYDNDAPFLLKLRTNKWDFTSLFSVSSRSARQLDFGTSLSMNMQLQAPHGGFWNSTGQAHVTELSIRKGAKAMVSEKPMLLDFKQGVVNSENFAITSGDSYLKLDVAGLSRSHLNASLNGKLDLSLLGLFTPFISDLRGNMAVSMDLKGSVDKPALSGSAYIDRGYAKFADFTHPFSNVRADILFTDNQVLLNAVRSDLANGKVSGEGKITFAGNHRRPVDVKGTFSDVKLNIPEGYKTQGSGSVAIHGDSFPYQMDIAYDISGGNIVAEFTEKASGTAAVKASPFLPRFLDQDSFHPFVFGADVNIKTPLSVNNSLVRANVDGHLRASGTPDRLAINGTLTPEPGAKVFFNEQPFEVTSAFVEYTGQGPTDPKIYVAANTHATETIVDDQNRATQNQYEVSMVVQGHAQAPQINFTSQPPLGQKEIVSLLAIGTTGFVANSDERKTSTYDQANPSAAVGSVLLDKAGGKKVKEALGVDLKVSTAPPQYDRAAAPKVTLSKQWTPKLGASASSTVESVPNNNVKLEYKLDKNVSVIGSWDGRETLHDQQKDTTPNVLGLDLQYKMQFK